MSKEKLSNQLIEDYKNGAFIVDLSHKYGLTYQVVKDQLMKMGLSKKSVWGGRRAGSGRKRKEKGSELQRIREHNSKTQFAKQPEGTRANPRSNLCRKYNNDFYMGGF